MEERNIGNLINIIYDHREQFVSKGRLKNMRY